MDLFIKVLSTELTIVQSSVNIPTSDRWSLMKQLKWLDLGHCPEELLQWGPGSGMVDLGSQLSSLCMTPAVGAISPLCKLTMVSPGFVEATLCQMLTLGTLDVESYANFLKHFIFCIIKCLDINGSHTLL